jgi:hypothetical protein
MIRSLTIQIGSTSGLGSQGELEVVFSRYDDFGSASQRPEFQYAVRVPGFAVGTDSDGTIAYGHDLRLASGSSPDHAQAMATLIDFLAADGEKYRDGLNQPHYDDVVTPTSEEGQLKRTGDGYLFNEQTAEWAYQLSDELGSVREELAGAYVLDREKATTDADALDLIVAAMSGESWNADTVERIAAVVRVTGRQINDVNIDA